LCAPDDLENGDDESDNPAESMMMSIKPIVLALSITAWATGAWGYAGDTHYYLRFATALETCFDWDEAHLIASADFLVDKNRTTTAEKHPAKKHNKINWHAFGSDQERFNALWERVLAEKDDELALVKLGQFLHFASDWEAHHGYGVRMGHGVPTIFARDPDSLGNDRENNLRMIDQTAYHMLQFCAARERLPDAGNDANRAIVDIYWELLDQPVMDKLFDSNTPRWKKWGKRWKMGKRILAENHLLVEELIALRAEQYPERDIPEDFTPGDPEKGLPPPLGVRYDKDGELLEVLGVEVQLLPEYDGTEMSAVEEDAFEERVETELVDDLEQLVQDGRDLDLNANVQLSLQDAELTENGWLVFAEYENLGSGPSKPGRLDLFVLDVSNEELLGQAEQTVPALAPDERFDSKIVVERDGEPTKRVLIGASLKVDDLSADNNDVWFVPWRNEVEDAQTMKKKKKQELDPGAVEFLGQPKIWVGDDGDGYLMVTAYVKGGDSARRLGGLRLTMGQTELTVGDTEGVWFSVPDTRRRLVPGRGIFWLPHEEQACREIDAGNRTIKIEVFGEQIIPASTSLELDDDLVRDVQAACTRQREAG
jgi:hypothetical protein